MACYHPLQAFQHLQSGEIFFVERLGRGDSRPLSLPCGRCVGCRLEKSRDWAVRCMHEAQLYGADNSFVTLTYADDKLPENGSLRYRDYQLFMKKLRKRFSCRFYMCGEYGSENFRPHYHAILFGVRFPDLKYFKKSGSGEKLYRSAVLEALWPHGNAWVGSVTFESAAYVARYCMKKLSGDYAAFYDVIDPDTGEVYVREPEFSHMSLRPGIGARWFERFKSDVYPEGIVIVNGRKARPSRYYDELFKRVDAAAYEELEHRRYLFQRDHYADSTDARLAVREEVATARLSFSKRS